MRQFLQSAFRRRIIWLPHESHAGLSLPSAVAGAGIWLRQESLRHILASPGMPPDNHGKCYMDGKRIHGLSNALQHVPICLQPFSSNSKFAILAHFLHILASPGYTPGTIAVIVTWIEREFNAGQTHCSIYNIYLQPFTSYSKILVGNCNFFLHPCI